MADQDIDPQIWEEVKNQLKDLSIRYSISSEELNKLAKGTQAFSTAQKVLTKNLTRDFENLAKKVKEGTDTLEDHKEALDKATKAIEVMEDGDEKRELQRRRQAIQSAISAKEVEKAVSESATIMGTSVVTGVGRFLKGLQDGTTSTQAATGLLSAGIDATEAGVVGLGKAAQSAGTSLLLTLNPYARAAGFALSTLGIAAETTAPALAKLAKFGVEYLSKEVEKTYKAFNQMSASGAMFADGMTGMVNAATESGLTIEQYSNVIKANSESLAAAGLSVSRGAIQIGEVLKLGDKTLRTQLLNLGYGFEEQAELVATVIKDMRGASAGPLRATNQQILEQTQKYADNLRIIASITGKDAKQKMEETRNQANQLLFQQNLAELDATQRQDIINAMGSMSEQQQKDFMDMVNFGTVINSTGAVLSATSASYSSLLNESAELAKTGNLNTENYLAIAAKYNTQIQQDFLAQRGIAATQAASIGGLGSEVASAMMGVINEIKNQTPEAIAAAKEAADKQKETTDGLTEAVVGAEVEFQNMKMIIQSELIGENGALVKFAEVTRSIITAFEDILLELNIGSDELRNRREMEKTWWDATKHIGAKMGQYGTLGAGAGAGVGLLGGPGAPVTVPSGAVVGGAIGAVGGLAQGAIDIWKGEYSKGGVASGPISGYQATLHGTEAVVPLPDNRSIPVTVTGKDEHKFDTREITSAIQNQSAILNRILASMEKNNQLTSGILQTSY